MLVDQNDYDAGMAWALDHYTPAVFSVWFLKRRLQDIADTPWRHGVRAALKLLIAAREGERMDDP